MDKMLNTLGLAYRAKKVVLGEEVLENIKRVKLLFIASDISEKSRERFLKKCSFYSIEFINEFNSEELSNALGKQNVKVIGVIDEGFTKSLLK